MTRLDSIEADFNTVGINLKKIDCLIIVALRFERLPKWKETNFSIVSQKIIAGEHPSFDFQISSFDYSEIFVTKVDLQTIEETARIGGLLSSLTSGPFVREW